MHHQGHETTEVGDDHFRSTGVKLWATVVVSIMSHIISTFWSITTSVGLWRCHFCSVRKLKDLDSGEYTGQPGYVSPNIPSLLGHHSQLTDWLLFPDILHRSDKDVFKIWASCHLVKMANSCIAHMYPSDWGDR